MGEGQKAGAEPFIESKERASDEIMSAISILIVIGAFSIGAAVAWAHSTHRLAKTLDARLRAKNAFLTVSAHQLRTPLNQVVGALQILDMNTADLTDKQRELIGFLHAGTENLSGALVDILDLLDIQSGKLEIERDEVNLERTIKTLERRFRRRAAEKGVEIEFDMKAISHWHYVFDELRFGQCVSSLMTQCLAQTEKGVVRVSAEFSKSQKKNAGVLTVTVRDDSNGMDQYATEAYFSPEKYEINRYMTNAEGRRLSLMLAKMLAEKMGGGLTVKSAIGSRVTFTLTLPVETALASEGHVGEATPLQRARALLADKTVLVVDDNLPNLMIVKAFLEQGKAGRVLTAMNGVEAVRAVEANKCDIVLMDVQMPEMDGVAATRKIRTSGRPFANVPIVALTAAARAEDANAYRKAGMNAVLAKPVNIDDMFETIEKVLTRPAARRAA